MYGIELILDLHHCQNAKMDMDIEAFCQELCELIGMDYETFTEWRSIESEERNPKTWGVSAVQFIITSNITIHVLPLYMNGAVLLNLFSCKEFDADIVVKFCEAYFGGTSAQRRLIDRL